MQSVSSRIWTRVIVSISQDDNHYTTSTSHFNISDIQELTVASHLKGFNLYFGCWHWEEKIHEVTKRLQYQTCTWVWYQGDTFLPCAFSFWLRFFWRRNSGKICIKPFIWNDCATVLLTFYSFIFFLSSILMWHFWCYCCCRSWFLSLSTLISML